LIEVGARAPDFSLPDQHGRPISSRDLAARRVVIAFYPEDFSEVCSNQLSVYQEVLDEIERRDASLVAISVDDPDSHRSFAAELGLTFPLLSDADPRGEVARAFGAYLEERGHSNRSLVLVDADGRVAWAHAGHPLEVPGANLIFDALDVAAGRAGD
jgi:peroxiredoxin